VSWRGGDAVLDPVVAALNGAPDDVKLRVCTALIASLLNMDWSPGSNCTVQEYEDDPIVLQAFRVNGHFLEYCHTKRDGEAWPLCILEKGHLGDHAGTRGERWPQDWSKVYGPLNEIETVRAELARVRECAEEISRRRIDYGRGDHMVQQEAIDIAEHILSKFDER
jgi:hypothetical protein